ncbi:MAG TPA: hypothetical protein VLW46_00790 [Candidatus Bathyarchaeia archaeon]|nr:hypothetical protein [Candidatus Bathyarchaeia archaeon]
MTAQEYQAPESVGRLQQRALIAAAIGLLLSLLALFRSPEQFFHSYLIAFLFILGLSLGSLGLLMLQHLTSGHWGIMIRRPLEAATRTLWLVAILFVPLILGMKYIYGSWLNAPPSGEGALSNFQKTYLTPQNFVIRGVIYFAVWLLLMFALNRWSRRQDVDRDDRDLRRKFKMLSGPGIILYVFGIGFASIDWAMSLSPHWFSTIYGFIFVVGEVISSLCLVIAMLVLLAKTPPFSGIIQPRHFHDLGKLLLAFVMLWAYFSFSQLLIIWSGNQPEEISFYRTRLYGDWGIVAVLVLIFHFFTPFFLLLSANLKRKAGQLTSVAFLLVVMRLVDLFWTTRPSFPNAPAYPSWVDIAVPLALIGLWLAVFAWNLKAMPLLPLGDPKLTEAIEVHEY